MRGSLMEMVLALAITGLIFASAIIPTMQIMADYQKAELDLHGMTLHRMGAERIAQTVNTIWRDSEPPTSHATLAAATNTGLRVGNWEVREQGGALEQVWQAGTPVALTTAVQSFGYDYLLNSGAWVAAASGAQLDQVLAVRLQWTDGATGRAHAGVWLAPDRTYSGGLLELLYPDTSNPYQRSNYEKSVTFAIGDW